jgi:hypothetical protein
MITAWMIYGLVVGALVAIAAVGAEQLLRVAARPTRWLWVAALVLTTGATLLAPLRGPSEPLRTGVRLALSASDAAPSPAPPVHRW